MVRERLMSLNPLLIDRLEIEPGEILIDAMEEMVEGGVRL